MKNTGFSGILIGLSLVSSSVLAADVGTLNTFNAGAAAVAADVNANFSDIKNAVNSKADKANYTCPAGKYIREISDTGSVTCSTDENSGDITGVSAGSGLTGGGTSGNVTISIATDSVTGSHLAPNAVGSSQVLNSSLTAADIKDEPAVDYNNGLSVYTSTSDTTNVPLCSGAKVLKTVTIKPPVSGYAVVFATGKVYTYATTGYIKMGLDNTSSTTHSYDGNNFQYFYDDGSTNYYNYSFNYGYYLSANTTYNFSVKACKSVMGMSAYVYLNSITAVFSPTVY